MLNDLPIDQLRSLVTISETNSFTLAAARLFRTQPALSLQIKKLEERVGTSLLERNGRTIGVTEAGKVLVDYARRILDLNEEALAKLSVTETEGIVRIGVLEEVAIGPLMHLLTKFGRLCTKVRLELLVSTSWELSRLIKSNELCLAVANHQYATAHTAPLWQEKYLWAHNPSYDLLSLDSTPIVMDTDYPCSLRDQAIQYLDKQKISWHVSFSSISLTAMQAAVRAGIGVGFLPESALTPDIIPLEAPAMPALEPAVIALYRGMDAKSEAVNTLTDFLITHLQTVPFLNHPLTTQSTAESAERLPVAISL
ncbi:MAG: LysR substrate-binding domain-containing protein [Rhodothermales bacterium]